MNINTAVLPSSSRYFVVQFSFWTSFSFLPDEVEAKKN